MRARLSFFITCSSTTHETRIAPVVHVFISRSLDDAPVDWRVTQDDAVLGCLGTDSLRLRTSSASLCTSAPSTHRSQRWCSPISGSVDRAGPVRRDEAIRNALIAGITELDDDIVDGAGEIRGWRTKRRQEFWASRPVAGLAECHEGEAIERVNEVVRRRTLLPTICRDGSVWEWDETRSAPMVDHRTTASQSP